MMIGPDPNTIYPLRTIRNLFFKKLSSKPVILSLATTPYFDDQRYGPEQFEEYNVLYNYDFSKVKLIIGKFCAIAAETRFIMTGDHKLDAISTYPFPIFQCGGKLLFSIFDLPVKGTSSLEMTFGLDMTA